MLLNAVHQRCLLMHCSTLFNAVQCHTNSSGTGDFALAVFATNPKSIYWQILSFQFIPQPEMHQRQCRSTLVNAV
jgi:hypothetical protein